ncbi:hypothetical protein [Halothermothrix orenii]|uniref:Arc-like DNA binding domain-containing protein n=1 Tax=Halothermothrix orenii (strain H 168 / OCM 544 / DSM 9562) TaxID=373903 RepID=B8D040_HALOH|nr:hypothetical protein [Halothermothrix orenii]ACL68794.1 hypothetical protein Hore_00320 [Halothermothrix orenii H 168]
MPTLQVRNLPEHIYNKIVELAEEDRRSITQETIILLEKALEMEKQNKKHRKKLLNKIINETKSDNFDNVPDPVPLIREDRQR